MCLRAPATGEEGGFRPRLDEFEGLEHQIEDVHILFAKSGSHLAHYDLIDQRLVSSVEDAPEMINRLRLTIQVVNDKRRVEEGVHQSSDPGSVSSARRARTHSTTLSEVAHCGYFAGSRAPALASIASFVRSRLICRRRASVT